VNRTRLKNLSSSDNAHAIWALALAAALCGPLGARAQAAASSAAERATAAAPAPTPVPPGSTASLGTPPSTPPPAPGSATNPRAALACQLVADTSPNGTGAGGGGVVQLVSPPGVVSPGVVGPLVLVSAPGLASGGAWASAERAGRLRERTVSFNFAFSNLDLLVPALLPRPQVGIAYRVERALIMVYSTDGGPSGPHMVDLGGALNGSQRGWSWNDSVTQTRLATSEHFSDSWTLLLRLSGQRVSTVLAAPPAMFGQTVRCELPIKH
jgi:hypothetical protein